MVFVLFQRIEAMLRVQENLREKNVGLAVALFRSAREVWPERDEFGTEGMSQEEEFLALKEVFMANLPSECELCYACNKLVTRWQSTYHFIPPGLVSL